MHMCEVCKAIKRFETLESPLIAGDYWVGRLDGRPAILSGEGQGSAGARPGVPYGGG